MERSQPGEDLGAASAPRPCDSNDLCAQETSRRAVPAGEKRRWAQRRRQKLDQM